MNESNVKCSKNLGIVMECTEITDDSHEKIALLEEVRKTSDGSSSTAKEKNEGSSTDGGILKSLQQTENSVIANESNEDVITFGKTRKKPVQQQSRVERSRLSLITFLNNITAPPTRGDTNNSGKSLRSQSISSPAPPQQQENCDKAQKPRKSTVGKALTDRQQRCSDMQEIVMAGEMPAASSDVNKDAEVELTTSYPVLADKLSIKSSVSTAASSNSVPSESVFSAGSGTSLAGSKSQKLRECPICCVRQPSSSFHRLKCCPHLACRTCMLKYLNTEIMESRTNISCPECPAQLHVGDIYSLLSHQPELLDRFELFSLRRALFADPDTRWCPAPDCIYAVIAPCAACPQLKCERCETMFCYHCKSYWHPSQTCDQARSKSFFSAPQAVRSSLPAEADNDVMKACPRCGALIMKMNDGSCNHMQCALCSAEFCWLCLKQINELHYLSPTGCTFWGKKPWTRKKKLLWQIGTLIGAPLGIALIAGLAVPGIICGVPIFVGRKTYQRFSNLTRTKRQMVTALSVVGSLLVSPVLAVMTVGVGVPIMLAYVYGVVPLSLCRNGACGGSDSSDGANGDDEVAYGEEVVVENADPNCRRQAEEKSSKSSFHHRRQSIASSGLASLADKPNTEDASIAAIAGSQYNYDNRSVRTIWSSGQNVGGHVSAQELAQEVASYNNDDAENASTMACCSASIVAQSSERRSLTGSSGSFKVRPRSSISNSRGASEEPGRNPAKFVRKTSRNNVDGVKASSSSCGGYSQTRMADVNADCHSSPDTSPANATSNISPDETGQKKHKKRSSLRSFFRHPMDTLLAKRNSGSLEDE